MNQLGFAFVNAFWIIQIANTIYGGARYRFCSNKNLDLCPRTFPLYFTSKKAASIKHNTLQKTERHDEKQFRLGVTACTTAFKDQRPSIAKSRQRLKNSSLRTPGGVGENRTPDLYNAIVALYQLSYNPDLGAWWHNDSFKSIDFVKKISTRK